MRVLIVGQKWFGGCVSKLVAGRGHSLTLLAPDSDNWLKEAAADLGADFIHHCIKGKPRRNLEGAFDLLIAAHAHVKIPDELISKTTWAVGYHPSLLPNYPGRNAVQSAISDMQQISGGSIFHLTSEFDAGPVAYQDWRFVPTGATPSSLWRDTLAPLGLVLIDRLMVDLETNGHIPSFPQASINGCLSPI